MKLPDGLFKVILDNINDAVYFVDRERRILYWNKAAENISGFKSEEVVGKKCSDNILQHIDEKGNILCLNGCPLTYSMAHDTNTVAKVFMHHKDGHRIPVVVKATPIKDSSGRIVGAAEVFYDNSQVINLREKIDALEELVMLDELTKLPNRRFIELNVKSKISEVKRYNRLFCIIFLDLDNFKSINDTYGHLVGDQILRMVATTVKLNLRYFDLVGRLSGDEFIIVAEIPAKEKARELAEKILTLIKSSFLVIENERVSVGASLGVYILKPSDTYKSAIEKADRLMYVSKKSGKNIITYEEDI